MSGVLQVAEGKDMETAVSYFREAATGSPNTKVTHSQQISLILYI